MKMKFEVLHNFISPVTGRILATPDYVLVGDLQGIATPSPILIDLRLDLINLRSDYEMATSASFVVGFPNRELPNAQVLYELDDGFMFNTKGIVSTTNVLPPSSLPDLTDGHLWIGDINNRPVEIIILPIGNMANLTEGNLWIGDNNNRPSETIILPIENMANLSYGKIWIGNLLGRPSPSDTISISNLPDLNYDQIWIGDINNRPVAAPTINVSNLPNLTYGAIWVGDITNRPSEAFNYVSGLYIPPIIQGDIAIWDSQFVIKDSLIPITDITDMQNDIHNIQDDINNIQNDINNIEGDINNIESEISTIQSDIRSIQWDITGINVRLDVQSARITALQGELVALTATVVALQAQVVALEGEIVALQGQIAGLAAAIGVLQGQVAALLVAITAVNERIDNLRLNNIPADGDVSIYDYKIIDLADPTDPQDAATKNYVDNAIGTSGYVMSVSGTAGQIYSTGGQNPVLSLVATGVVADTYSNPTVTVDEFGRIVLIEGGTDSIILIGDVIGAGILGVPIVTTFTKTLNQIPNDGDIDINNYKIINSADATDPKDLVNLETLQSYISNIPTSIVLEGDVTGTGNVGTPIETTLELTLDQIKLAGNNVDLNNHKIINLIDPTDPQDAATKHYVDEAIAIGTDISLIGFVEGGPPVGGVIDTIRTPGNLDMQGDRVINLKQSPVEDFDAVSMTFLWDLFHDEVEILWL
jgi:hypothetical protein